MKLKHPPQRFALQNTAGLKIEVTDLAASWMSCKLQMRDGSQREVLLGFDDPVHHLEQPGSVGVTVGRYANRIANARYVHAGTEVKLAANEGVHQLHGGPDGFSRRRWRVDAQSSRAVQFSLLSADGDQGFPGEVNAVTRYRIDDDCSITIEYVATTTKATPLALTNHAYLNLDGEHSDCRKHRLSLRADQYVPIAADCIPLGKLVSVSGTDFDFRSPRRIADTFMASQQQQQVQGYDHCFLLDPACRDGSVPAAELISSDERVVARLYTDRPALQFYTGQKLATTQRRGGGAYGACSGLALEPGVPPDSPNRPQWAPWSDCFATPGATWRGWMRWVFEAR